MIFSTHRLHPRATAMLAGHGDFVVASALDHTTLAREGREADIVIVRAPLPETLFDNPPRLRAAIRHGAGLDMVPLAAANAAGVLVANTPGVNARTVAEHVFFVSMALLRRFRAMDRDLRTQGWDVAREHTALTHDLWGRSIGIVGMGNIGREVASIAVNGFGLNVAAATRRPGDLPQSVTAMPLDALMAANDIVVICCPLTDETRGMIDARRIGRMKPDALLVNVSRGPVIDDAALIAALREGRLGGAALDVFSTQPLPNDHPYFSFENVIVTPHMAGITEESMMRMGVGAAEETIRVLRNGLPLNLRNPEVVEHYRRRFPDHQA